MRNVGPVTQKEHLLAPDVKIVSRTDLQGNIIAANEDFIDASGYQWNELVGQPHNILRHPDVPEAVFKDFWETIQAGKPWSQIVKNRCKNGDHYWVHANATPIFENGEAVGYMSFRTPPSREEIAAAEKLYVDVNEGRVAIKNGEVKKLSQKFNLWRQFDAEHLTLIASIISIALILLQQFVPQNTNSIAFALFLALEVGLMGVIIGTAFYNGRVVRKIMQLVTLNSEGNFSTHIDAFGQNNLYKALGRIKSMQIKLGADFDDSKYALESAKRIEYALGSASSNVMVADRFRSIIFMNDSVKKMLKDAEKDLQETLPNFDADNLLHQSIDQFHVNPAHQSEILDKLTTTYEARIKVGRVTIDLVINPIFDDAGERLGTVAEWKNMTAQLAVEEMIEEIISEASQGMLQGRIDETDLVAFEKHISLAINKLLTNFSESLNSVNAVLAKMSQGNLTARMDGDYEGQLNAMKLSVNNALSNLEISLGQIKNGALEIGTMASEVATASNDLSERTQQQAASLEETAASLEEITSTTKQTADNAMQANELAADVSKSAQEGIKVMNGTLESMVGITELSKKVGDITSVIDSIAFQTNLLALNAAVEAARAGEHGRGFAVVAGEVRSLAQKSAEAAKDISQLIQTTTHQIESGTAQVQETNEVFEQMVDKIHDVVRFVSDVSQTSQEQAKGIGQINLAMNHLDQATQQNAALVEELSATATNMSDQAQTQAEVVKSFTIGKAAQSMRSQMSGQLAQAKIAHNTWIMNLELLLSGSESVDFNEHTAHDPNACGLGKWLNTTGTAYQHLTAMQMLTEAHKKFHRYINEVIQAHHSGDKEKARKTHSQLEKFSHEINAIIDQLDAELGRASPQLTSTIGNNQPSASLQGPTNSTSTTGKANRSNDEWDDF